MHYSMRLVADLAATAGIDEAMRAYRMTRAEVAAVLAYCEAVGR